MTQALLIFKTTIAALLWDIISFPVWWYSVGLWKFLKWMGRQIADMYKSLGLGVWLKNLFVPMFGQYDRAGRAISFVLRLFEIIVRGLWLLIWMAMLLVLFTVWIAAPIAIVYFLWENHKFTVDIWNHLNQK